MEGMGDGAGNFTALSRVNDPVESVPDAVLKVRSKRGPGKSVAAG